MKRVPVLFYLLMPLLVVAQRDSIVSGVYEWKEPANTSQPAVSTILFEGQAHDIKKLTATSNYLYPAKNQAARYVPDDEEHLIIVRSGILKLEMKDSMYSLGTGSIALLMPGEQYFLQSTQKPCSYYTLRYHSLSANAERGRSAGGSKIIHWDTVTLKTNAKGGRRDFLNRPTAMSRRVEIHATTLQAGFKSHDPHTHPAPEMIIVTEGQTEMQVGSQFYKGGAGSVYFLGSNVLHALENKGSGNCTYFAIQLE